jgi:D-psicose/D-tagatose/L-ribulose 3-epimerase
MFSNDNDLSAARPIIQQNAIGYIRRNIDRGAELGARYFLVVPGAVGRPKKYDDMEYDRSVEAAQKITDIFIQIGIRATVEPLRRSEFVSYHSLCKAVY